MTALEVAIAEMLDAIEQYHLAKAERLRCQSKVRDEGAE